MSIVCYNFSNSHLGSCHISQASSNRYRFLEISTHKDGRNFQANHGLFSLSTGHRVHSKSDKKMDMTVYNSVEPGAPLSPGGTPSNSRKFWILGAVSWIILPFLKHKWGPLLALKNKVDTVVDRVESVVDVVEMVAEKVEKIADEVADKLPEGGKLKDTVSFVEIIAKEAAKDANLAEEFIHKVEEVEKELESLVEPVMDQANEAAKETSNQNR
ncbi:hypothetical protein HHK36_009550 [Tetracentron sinense]|uniref:Uncharacterized protein n=1 Tax=Tetracentron sinense TaxID=13715 RepID=A0A834ZLJ5_TETSI|nr:hypothetical protein HHK36_009550 [Tetracentron sinense]